MTERKWKTRSWVVIDHDQVWADDLVCTVCNNETANLIASAPELYEVLEKAEKLLVQFEMASHFYKGIAMEAREALAKARGEIK